MRNIVVAITLAVLAPAVAADECGQQPLSVPTLPSGTTATPDDMRVARDQVIAYSNEIDAWLNCMDQRIAKLSPYMTAEQRERWQEDSTTVHDTRRELQVRLNAEIRNYRNAQKGS